MSVTRAVAEIGKLYWAPEWPLRPAGSLAALGAADWREALGEFVGVYAYQRQGSSPRYPIAARKAIAEYASDRPGQDIAQELWERFLDALGDERDRPNARVNPLNPAGGRSVAALIVAASQQRHNVVAWAAQGLIAGRVTYVSASIQRVRGIGPKISAFFLRDVAAEFDVPEERLEPPQRLIPIDVWTRRGAVRLADLEGLPRPATDAACAQVLHSLALRDGIRAADLDVGLWILGAVLLRGEEMFLRALGRPEFIHELVGLERKHWIWRGDRVGGA